MSNSIKRGPEYLALFGARIKARRMALGLKQTHAADMAGFTRSQMSNLEAGRSWVSVETMAALCDVLKCTPNDLLGYGRVAGGIGLADLARARESGRKHARKEFAKKIREALR